jgi:DNA-binding IclR family transcriptional regulator
MGHDRRPGAFLVYLFLLRHTRPEPRARLAMSLQTIATKTGLSKSCVQQALRHLMRRGLLDPALRPSVTATLRRVLRPWVR